MTARFVSFIALLLLCLAATVQAKEPRSEETVKELSYGVSLFHLFQGQTLSAITDIAVARQRGRLAKQADDAELLLGSLYYDFGLSRQSEQIFQQMLDAKQPAAIKNRIWFNLAKVQYGNRNFTEAQQLLARIDGSLSPQWHDQQYYMLSNIYSRQQQFKQASEALQQIDSDSLWSSYAEFNLGAGLLANKDDPQRLEDFLDKLDNSIELQALQDKARFMLGMQALRANRENSALDFFNEIHIDAPLSNRALLATGWAWYKKSNVGQAVKYWTLLRHKKQPDGATQEAIMALADAFEKTGDKAQAIQTYQQAAGDFDLFVTELDRVIERIKSGEFIESLTTGDMNKPRDQNSSNEVTSTQTDFYPYLYTLLIRDEFQQAVQSYQQLKQVQTTLDRWQQNLPVYQLMLKERRQSFEAKHQQLDVTSNENYLQQLENKRQALAKEVEAIHAQQDFRALANEDEVDYLDQLQEIKSLISKLQDTRDVTEAQQKYRLMSGLLDYRLQTEFPARFWKLSRQLQLLDRALLKARQAVQSLVVAAQHNKTRLDDFDRRIAGQQQAISQQREFAERLIERQRAQIERLAIDEIERQKQHTLALRLSARYSAAKLLDEMAQQSALDKTPETEVNDSGAADNAGTQTGATVQ